MTDDRAIVLFVPGHPVPKGSGEGTAARRRSYRTGVAGAWRERLQLALGRYAPREPWEGAIGVRAVFHMGKPKHPVEPMVAFPDVDKLVRFVLDEASSRIYIDDSQVVEVVAQKSYTPRGQQEGVSLSFERLSPRRATEHELWTVDVPNALPELPEVTA